MRAKLAEASLEVELQDPRLVTAHDGRIQIVSHPSSRTIVTIEIPR